MKFLIYSFLFLGGFCFICQQNSNPISIQQASQTPIGGPCEGCEAVNEYNESTITSIDTLPEFEKTEPKLKITGTVFQKDGKTPAENVILYIYHTDKHGIYKKKGDETGWAKTHGFIRGWVKTKADGKYTFYTFRPSGYPELQSAEHIHLTVKEPNKKEYYLDDFLFDDDPLLNQAKRGLLRNRGGSGITHPILKNGILYIQRDLILGKNIPNYH